MHVYKYRSIGNEISEKYTRDIFENFRLYCSQASEFNDPFDSYPYYEMEYTDEELEDYLQRTKHDEVIDIGDVKNYFLNLTEHQKNSITYKASQKQRRAISACCFSKNNSNILMWSHYADSHKGICLRFKFQNTGIRSLDNLFEIKYENVRPVLNRFKKPHNYTDVFVATNTKSKLWEYENEVRIFPDKFLAGPCYINFPKHCLDGVIFGASCSIKDRLKVIGWINEFGCKVELMEAVPNQKEYRLEIKSLRPMNLDPKGTEF